MSNPLAAPSENSFQVIFQTSNEGIIMADAEGVIKLANPTSERMFGYENGELIGKNIDVLVPNATKARHVDLRKTYERNPHPRVMGMGRDLTGLRKDGSELPIEVSLSHTRIEGAFHVVSFIIDITQRKKIEEKLKDSEAQLITYATELENRVKSRTEDLHATVTQLEEANQRLKSEVFEREKAEQAAVAALEQQKELNELKSRFVSTASHEFRTPLSAILSSVSLIDKYIQLKTVEKAQKHINKIKSSVKHLTDILNDFLSVGKLEEGKIAIEKEALDLSNFIKEVLSGIEGILKPGQQVSVEEAKGLPTTIHTDEKLIKHILINLLSNASKYSGDNSEIKVALQANQKEVQLSVTDQGIGIPADEQHHLFDRFFRAKNATNIQGTGLGLNIVKKYVELLEGEITFESVLSEGTTFTVRLPLSTSEV